MSLLHIDFETRSTVDLRKTGLDLYARDPSTDVWCMAFAFDEGPIELWHPDCAKGALRAVHQHVAAGGIVIGHNVAFEWAIWNKLMAVRHGWPRLAIGQCRCTMAMAYAMGLPGSLENAAAAVGLTQQKDMKGHRLMLQMARPRRVDPDGTLHWWDDADRRERLYDYCRQDVETERALHKRVRDLSPYEQRVWELDHKINERGVRVDVPAVTAARDLVTREKARLDAEMKAVTGNAVGACSNVNQLTDWLRFQGIETGGIAKVDVVALLAGDLPPAVRRALELRQEAAKSSTAKLDAMLEAVSTDGRVRGLFQYHGAATGRWAGRKVQLQNLPRGNLGADAAGMAIDGLLAGWDGPTVDMLFGPPIDVVSSCLRGFLVAGERREFIAADFANIEGRVLAWLAGETWKVDAFRAFDAGHGADIYKLSYSRSFGVPVEGVTKDQRQVGKVQELALGYGGGVGAFQSMARIYGVQVPDEKADQIKVAWREAHPRVKSLWADLEYAACAAVRQSGTVQTVGRIRYVKRGSFLWCQLPSGRVLCYPYPRLVETETPWGTLRDALQYMAVNGLTKKWEPTDTYGGALTENVVQAIARDLLADAMLRLDAEGFDLVMHVHDEVVVEVDAGSEDVREVEQLIAHTPAWAEGLPVAAEGWRGFRYRK